jgi:hypothetical protein
VVVESEILAVRIEKPLAQDVALRALDPRPGLIVAICPFMILPLSQHSSLDDPPLTGVCSPSFQTQSCFNNIPSLISCDVGGAQRLLSRKRGDTEPEERRR